MELIAFVLVILAFIVALFVGIAVLATLGALLVRVFGKQIWRWLEWLEDSFDGGWR